MGGLVPLKQLIAPYLLWNILRVKARLFDSCKIAFIRTSKFWCIHFTSFNSFLLINELQNRMANITSELSIFQKRFAIYYSYRLCSRLLRHPLDIRSCKRY